MSTVRNTGRIPSSATGRRARRIHSRPASQAIAAASVTRPRSRAHSGTNARSAIGTAPMKYSARGMRGTPLATTSEITNASVPSRKSTELTTRACPSGPARRSMMVVSGSFENTRLITTSTPTKLASAKKLTANAIVPSRPARRPNARNRPTTRPSAKISATGARSCVRSVVAMSALRLAALTRRISALPAPATAASR